MNTHSQVLALPQGYHGVSAFMGSCGCDETGLGKPRSIDPGLELST